MSKDLQTWCLDVLRERRRGAGDVTRHLMGLGILPKDDQSYLDVKATLSGLLAAGKVTKAGNGKSVHWRVVP